MKNRMPVLFIGHGSPMNAIEDNEFTKQWECIASRIPSPRAILCISAHWLNNHTAVVSTKNPRTIHDFYGFPDELYKVNYHASGSLKVARLVKDTIKTLDVTLDDSWGLDHGSWSVLVKMFPKADIPVVQLSINPFLPLEAHIRMGRELSVLRDKGVLIMGSGNIVHNLGLMRVDGEPYPWAISFNKYIVESLIDKNTKNLLGYDHHKDGLLSVPTTDHYIPLLYAFGASMGEKPSFFCDKVYYSSLSMTCVVYGMND